MKSSVTKVSRRAVAKGAAWAVPATVISVAAPAFAQSTQTEVFVDGWLQTYWNERNVPHGVRSESGYILSAKTEHVSLPWGKDFPSDEPLGLWVKKTEGVKGIREVRLRFKYPKSQVYSGVKWEVVSRDGWTVPSIASGSIDFYEYETVFKGQILDETDRFRLLGSFDFIASFENPKNTVNATDVTPTVERRVTVITDNGDVEYTFERSLSMCETAPAICRTLGSTR